jgi:SAM-dependent methyltransferase
MAAFDAWAEYYDLIHPGTPGDVAFYLEHALDARGDVLELGVGTGRIAIPCALAGVNVTGLDNSRAMLVLCREKLRDVTPTPGRLRLVLGDMRSFRVHRKFRLVMIPYRTFMHLLTPKEQQQCLHCAYAHLDDGGRLVLNVWAAKPSSIAKIQSPRLAGKLKLARRYRIEDAGLSLLHLHEARCDEMNQILLERHVLRELDRNGRIVREAELPLVRAWTTRRELEHLFALCGFEVEALYGSFAREAFTAKSTELIYMLRKRA